MLTSKQNELLKFIHQRLTESGVSPSFDEMKEALDLRSKSGIHRLIMALEERGFIRRLPNRARALEVLKPPKLSGQSTSGFSPSVIEGSLGKSADSDSDNDNEGNYARIPVMGRIAAGVPIEAIQDHQNTITVSPEILGIGTHFALEVRGDSMVDAGILEGDTIVVRESSTATPGDIVVALVDDEEATLKRFRRKGDSIALEPANESYETQIYGQERVKVQGCLVGLVRKY